MNTASKSMLFAALCLSLAACASTSEPRFAAASSSADGYDKAYVAAVERAGRVRGVKVVWINPPDDKTAVIASND